jgi:hypothetical protein
MSGDSDAVPPSSVPGEPPPRAPANRVRPGFIVAIAVAVLMALGIGGLIAAALLGNDDLELTGDRLRPTVNVGAPATAPAADAAADAADDEAASSASPATTPVGGDDFSGESPSTAATLPPMTTVRPVDDIEAPPADDLPLPASGPVELPVLVTNPAPPSTHPAVPVDEFDPGGVPGLDGWIVADRERDLVSLTNGDVVIEILTMDDVVNADDALEQFYDRVGSDLEEMERSPITRLGAPSSRFESVAGSEYVATMAGQQGTSVMTGAIVAGVRADGTGIVVTSSRSGPSSPDELVADALLLNAILARL